MTNEEKLEEIRLEYSENVKVGLIPRVSDSDIEWLIQQAERVQELDSELSKTIADEQTLNREIGILKERNKRYRETLEEVKSIAEDAEYSDEMSMVFDVSDGVLEESKNGNR